MIEYEPLLLTIKLAAITTLILFVICLPLSHWLAYSQFRLKVIVQALITLPLVLPPSVLGFYLLMSFSPQNSFGNFLYEQFGVRLVFTFSGLVVASVLYSLPFMVHPLHSGFRSVPYSFKEAAYTMGKNKFTTLMKVLLPNMRASLLTAVVLTFAHTIGEFGVVLMVGGNIPDQTRVISIAIYDEVQAMNYSKAGFYSILLSVFTYLLLIAVYMTNRKFEKSTSLI